MRFDSGGVRAYPYKVTEPPTNGAVSLDTFKAHLRISNSNQDEVLQLYLDAAIKYAEEFMGLDLISRTYKTYRDYFPWVKNEGYYPAGCMPETLNQLPANTGFEIRRSPFKSLVSLQYVNKLSNSLTAVNSAIYYVTQSVAGEFSNILNNPNSLWPYDSVVPRQDAIEIVFISGFGDDESDIPADIKTAILEHASKMFFERGDCTDCGCSSSLPAISRGIYQRNKVLNL